jgi:hypothetical protein
MASAAFARHLSAMLNTRHHGETVVWVNGQTTYTVVGILDEAVELTDDGNGVLLPIGSRTLTVKANALPSIPQGARLTVSGVQYEVRSPALLVEDGELARFLVAPLV